MNIFLTTLGCRLNEAELARWRRQFEAAGHRVVGAAAAAHVVVLNTCAVTTEAGKKSRQLARRLHRENPLAKIVATGCYSELEPAAMGALRGVDLCVANQDKPQLVEQVLARIEPAVMPELATEPDAAHVYAETHTRAFIKVQDGCRNQCAFCVVTLARGEERSRTLDALVAEIDALHREGLQEVVLTGVHLGGYGSDLGVTLSDLVRAVLTRTKVPRVRLSSLEPWDLPHDFFELWREPRLCQHLHLPLQSGSDSVLKRMARRCLTHTYRELVERARQALPDLVLTTDLIVGFPGESEAEFAQTLAFVEAIGFAHVHIFTYSPRPGTRAARLPGRVPGDVQRARSRQVHALATTMKRDALERALGTERPVLWERGREASADGQPRFTGYTDTYLRVETTAPPGVDLHNRITPTRLVAVLDDERFLGVVPSP